MHGSATRQRRCSRRIACAVAIVTLGILLAPIVPAFIEARRLKVEILQLKRILLSLRNYHEVFGAYPPVVTRGSDGDALYCWRVPLMPWCCRPVSYDVAGKWSDPGNESLRGTSGNPFVSTRCSEDERTCVVAFVGAGSFFEDPCDAECNECYARNRAVCILGSPVGVHWMEESDLEVNDVVRSTAVYEVLRRGRKYLLIGFGDGVVVRVEAGVSLEQLLRVAKWGPESGTREEVLDVRSR